MLFVAYVHAYVPKHNAGAETTLHNILKSLVDRGHEAVVVLRERPLLQGSEYVYEGVRVIQASDKKTIVHHLPKADAVFTHFECAERASLLAKKFKIPLIHLVHNDYDIIKRQIAVGTDVAVFNTHWLEEHYSDLSVVKFTVHPYINPEDYKTDHGKKVTLVNLWDRKGHEIFYELAERMPDVEFLGVKGGYGEQVIRDFPNVEIMENTPNMKEVFGKTKVVLMPSQYESYGRVAVEASASGIPSIVTPTRGLREALGESGTYVEYSDVDGWENALRAILRPRKYGTLSRLSLENSNRSWVKAQQEMDVFALGLEQYINLSRKLRG